MTTKEAQIALANLKRYISGGGVIDRDINKAIDMAIEALERKKGKWHIIKGTGLAFCDCGYLTDRYSIYDFCPVCGAKNESE